MKQIGISVLVVILLVFVSPLIDIKDRYKEMEYQEVGDVMLKNVDVYIEFLDSTSSYAETASNFIQNTLNYIRDIIKAIGDFVKGIFENKTGTKCSGNYENGFTCGSSDGGGGGNFGGR